MEARMFKQIRTALFVLLFTVLSTNAFATTSLFGADIGGGQCRGFLTSGTSFTTPADWNNAANTVEAIGEGGNGFTIASAVSGSGGGGGAYAKVTNITLSGTIAYQ